MQKPSIIGLSLPMHKPSLTNSNAFANKSQCLNWQTLISNGQGFLTTSRFHDWCSPVPTFSPDKHWGWLLSEEAVSSPFPPASLLPSNGHKISWFNCFLLFCCTSHEKEAFLENLHDLFVLFRPIKKRSFNLLFFLGFFFTNLFPLIFYRRC